MPLPGTKVVVRKNRRNFSPRFSHCASFLTLALLLAGGLTLLSARQARAQSCPTSAPRSCSNSGGYCCPDTAPYCTSTGTCSSSPVGGGTGGTGGSSGGSTGGTSGSGGTSINCASGTVQCGKSHCSKIGYDCCAPEGREDSSCAPGSHCTATACASDNTGGTSGGTTGGTSGGTTGGTSGGTTGGTSGGSPSSGGNCSCDTARSDIRICTETKNPADCDSASSSSSFACTTGTLQRGTICSRSGRKLCCAGVRFDTFMYYCNTAGCEDSFRSTCGSQGGSIVSCGTSSGASSEYPSSSYGDDDDRSSDPFGCTLGRQQKGLPGLLIVVVGVALGLLRRPRRRRR